MQTEPERRIVGIVGDMRAEELNEAPLPAIYVPLAQLSDELGPFLVRGGPLAWLVRTTEDPQALVGRDPESSLRAERRCPGHRSANDGRRPGDGRVARALRTCCS